MVDCKTCKHNVVCKYKDEYIRVRDESNLEEFTGVFNISCREYIECECVESCKTYLTDEEIAQKIYEKIMNKINS